ncbi:hypothetical protein NLI96_g3750 [Meripilus lineatus]|uniref:Protein CPL1-like domain-containing protein n=1 Tax=Meripilus lineatus TaxID=2056292 RepID=A0AAD5V6D8_9APHY|nr:hypothetical protein NLI96_g3750 [Physisporinus lineatus]
MRSPLPFVLALALSTFASARTLTHLASRGSSDVCAFVDVGINILGITQIGALNICVCISGIPDLIRTNAKLNSAVNIVGIASVTAQLNAAINKSSGHKPCSFPDNALSACTKGNPCGFTCKNGFTPFPPTKPTECKCLPPKKVCNGVCGDFKACPSGKPKREELEKRSVCDYGYTACGIYGWTGFRSTPAYECIDTSSDLESCGGCAIPLAPGSPRGIDCTAIPGVVDVSCRTGNCVVHRCQPGFTVSMDQTFCIKKAQKHFQDNDVSAKAYGLEHVPLK